MEFLVRLLCKYVPEVCLTVVYTVQLRLFLKNFKPLNKNWLYRGTVELGLFFAFPFHFRETMIFLPAKFGWIKLQWK